MDIGMMIGRVELHGTKNYYIYRAVCLNPYFEVKSDVIGVSSSF
jgi:hypothetical protein